MVAVTRTLDAVIFDKFAPLPKKERAVTELIPEIFVAVSPTIFPLALISPETVSELRVPSDVTFVCAAVCNVPVKVEAVTPAIPVIFVALSPTIFPFAFILPETAKFVLLRV